MSCTITVGIAVYNVKAYLDACIQSVLSNPCGDMEILIIDDGSSDGSGAQCQSYAQSDSRIRFIQFEQNKGICAVRNTIIREARGEWLYFVDGDDILPPHFCETALSCAGRTEDILLFHFARFEQTPSFACAAPALTINTYGREMTDALSRYCIGLHLDQALSQKADLNEVELTSIWGKTYRRSFLLEHHIFFPDDQKKSQDMVFNISAYHNCQNIALIPVQMYGYRVNQQSVCNRYNPEMIQIIHTWFQNTLSLAGRYYSNDPDLLNHFYESSVILGMINCVRLDFFHPDNPKPYRQRKQEFLQFIGEEPFRKAISRVKIDHYYLERQFTLKNIKNQNTRLLDFSYRHPWVFHLYGGIMNRWNKLKKNPLKRRYRP